MAWHDCDNARHWTEGEDALLRELSAQGKSRADAMAALGRGYHAVYGRCQRIGVRLQPIPRQRRSFWTDERVALLECLWTEGKSARDIAERLGGTSRNAVIGKAHRLGLVHPTRAECAQ